MLLRFLQVFELNRWPANTVGTIFPKTGTALNNWWFHLSGTIFQKSGTALKALLSNVGYHVSKIGYLVKHLAFKSQVS